MDTSIGQGREALVDDDRAERDTGAVLDRERGVDHLAHRRLLGQGDEHHLTSRGIRDQADDVLRLLAHRADLHGIDQAPRREQERDRVAGGRRVDDHEIGRARLLDRLDLAENEDLLHTGNRGRDDLERARVDEPLRDALHPVRDEVVDEGRVGRQEPRPRRVVELDLLVAERRRAEHRRQSRLPLDLDDEHRTPGAAAVTASAPVTVVFPTPPFPATITTREVEQKSATSIGCMVGEVRAVHPTRVFVLVALCGWTGLACAGVASAQGAASGRIDVVQVNGLLDPSNAALIRSTLRGAERLHSTVLVYQMDASGAVDVDVSALVRDFERTTVPVAVWVGPSSGGARSAGALLASAAGYAAVAPGADLGPVMLTNNAGFNCNASRVVVQHEGWSRRERLLAAMRQVFEGVPSRRAYYPGAEERWSRFVAAHPEAELFGARTRSNLPWVLIPGVDPDSDDEVCFTTEAFAGVFAETALEAPTVPEFVDRAVAFCNERLWGTLNATLVVHGASLRDQATAAAVERAVANLRYGTVSINHWAAVGYGLVSPPWGAFPGHHAADIQSGVGVVHNTPMFSRAQKSVVRSPFRAFPKPPWFVSHKTAHLLAAALTAFEADPSPLKLPEIFWLALRG